MVGHHTALVDWGQCMEHVRINIYFEWSTWTPWEMIYAFRRHQARGIIPPQAGVFEIRRTDAANPDELLYIGSSRKLTTRLYNHPLGNQRGKRAEQKRQALLDEVGHKTELLVIRWATAEEYLALEHYLLRQYIRRFGKPPKYVAE